MTQGMVQGFSLDYPYIRAWGKMMDLTPERIDEELDNARRDNAPAKAIYSEPQVDSGAVKLKWFVYDDIESSMTRKAVDEDLEAQR